MSEGVVSLTESFELVSEDSELVLYTWGSATWEETIVEFWRLWFELTCTAFERALDSSIAERLQDRARNSIDSVGVSGGAQDNTEGIFAEIFFSSMFCRTS